MVDDLIGSSEKETAVLLITQDTAVVERVQEALQHEHPIWGAFMMQVSATGEHDFGSVPDVILLDWVSVEDGTLDTAVLPANTAIILLMHELTLMQNALQTAYTEIYLLPEITSNSLPRIIQSTIRQRSLLHTERQQRLLAEALRDINARLNETLDLDEVLDRILTHVGRVVPYDKVNIMLVNGAYTESVRLWGYDNYPEVIGIRFALEDAVIFADVIASKLPVLISDVYNYSGWVNVIPTTHSWVCVPILINDEVKAFICLDKKETNFYQQEHVAQLEIFAGQVALAMEKAQLYAATQRQLDELAVLHDLVLAGAEAADEDELIEKGAQIIGRALYPDNFGVLLLDEEKQNLIVHPSYHLNNVSFAKIPVTQGIVGYVVRTKRPYYAPDVREDPHYMLAFSEIRSEICVPLLRGDELLGVVNVASKQINAFSKEDERLLITLANQLSIGIERMRLFELERRRRKQAEILREAAITLNATLDMDTLFGNLLDFVAQYTTYDAATVMLVDEQGRLEIKAIRGYEGRDLDIVFDYPFSITETPTFKRIYETKKPYMIADTLRSPDWDHLLEEIRVRSWLGAPLVVGDEVIGCYSLDKLEVNGFSEEDIRFVEALTAQTAVSLQNIQLLQTTQRAVEESNIVNTISQTLNAAPDIAEVFPKLSRSLRLLTDCQFMSIFLFTENDQQGVIIALDDPLVTDRNKRQHISLEDTAFFSSLAQGEIHLTPDLTKEVGDYAVTQMLYKLGVRSRLNIPLISGGKVLGSLNLGWEHNDGYQRRQIPLLTQIANAIAHALERSRLFEEIKEWAQYLTVLHEFSHRITEAVEVEALCNTAVSYLTHRLNYLATSIYIVDAKQSTIVLQAREGVNKETLVIGEYRQQFGEGIIGLVAQTQRMIHVPDTRKHPDFLSSPRMAFKSEITFPLRSGGKLLGILDVNSDTVHAFSEEDVAILTIVADQIAVSLSNAILFVETSQRTAELQALFNLSTVLRMADTLDEIIPVLLQQLLQITGGSFNTIYLVEEKTGDLIVKGNYPYHVDLRGQRNKKGKGIVGHVATTGEIYITQDLHTDPLASFSQLEASALDFMRSGIHLPLKTQNSVVGVLNIGFVDQRVVSEEEIRLLTAVSEIAGSAVQRASMMDTLEQRVAERTSALADANEQLKELDQLKSKFVADVSHELRTPITNINLYLDLIEQGSVDKQERYLSVLRQQADRLVHLIEDTLNLSRIELGKEIVTFHPFNLNEVAEVAAVAHKPRAEAANLEMILDFDSHLPNMFGERNQLAQVVANLLANAINYTVDGSIRISTQWHPTEDEVWLIVTDTGMGINPEDLPHLFDRFYRGQEVSQSTIAGTGLGLAIIKEVVDIHAGKISIESALGVGTTIKVQLPIYR